MCGIWASIGRKGTEQECSQCLNALKARGPEGGKVTHIGTSASLGFTRLAINGLHAAGMQPMVQGSLTWICNGELYNWKEVAERHSLLCLSDSESLCVL
jgi:asparagine synthase (glutamine-hydrolysing)